MITVELTSNITGRLLGEISSDLKKRLMEVCSYEVQGSFFAPGYQAGCWDGRKNLLSPVTWKFPLGLFARIRFVLKEKNIPFEVVDLRQNPNITFEDYHLPGINLRDYQEEAIKTALQRGRGIIKLATGAGKSICIAGIIKALGKACTINIFAHRNTLLRQMEKTFIQVGIKDIGFVGDSENRPNRVNLISVAAITHKQKDADDLLKFCDSNKNILNSAQAIIIDECQHTPANTFQIISKYSANAYYRFGCSATPYRDDGADVLIESFAGRLLVDYGASNLIKRNWLVKPTIYFFQIPSIPKFSKKDGYATIYKEAVVENELRNTTIAMLVEKCYRENKTCLVAVNHIKQGELLYELVTKLLPKDKVAFIQGSGSDGIEKLQALKDLDDRKLMCILSTTVFGEGVDVPNLQVLINAKAAKSAVDTFQLCGRVLRRGSNKDHATIIDIADQTMPYLKSHSNTRLKILSLETEFSIQKVSSISEVTL